MVSRVRIIIKALLDVAKKMPSREELMKLKHTLLNKLNIVLDLYPELWFDFYLEFNRRFEVIKYLNKYIAKGMRVCELGSQPFILSAMIKSLGYDVVAVDVEPEKYIEVANVFKIPVLRCDLERDKIPVDDEFCECVVFSEVLEHLNPYYVSHTLTEINRVLKKDGFLILTTPNIASLYRRLKLLLGKQPIYRYHVKEYTKNEVMKMLEDHGFKIIELLYSDINDKSFLYPRNRQEARGLVEIESYIDMLKFTIRNNNTTNVLRTIAYPLVKLIPSLRMLIVVVARKTTRVKRRGPIVRWG